MPDAPIDAFRGFFQRHVSSVTLITAADAARRAGLTATAVCSLTDTPPSVIVSVGKASRACPIIRSTRRFGVNLLREDQDAIASAFARHAGDDAAAEAKFATGRWIAGPDGVPVLEDALAALTAEVVESTEIRTHVVFYGLVRAVQLADEGRPLLYGFRQFCALSFGK